MIFLLLLYISASLNTLNNNSVENNSKSFKYRPIIRPKHGSPRPVGANKKEYEGYDKVLTGYTNSKHKMEPYYIPIFNCRTHICTSWATATTAAMSMSLSIHAKRQINLSLQYIIDCDFYGDPCSHRPAFNAYEPFYRRLIPQADKWDESPDHLRTPTEQLTKDICDDPNGCYPGWSNCPRTRVLTGSCGETTPVELCPVHYLGHWKPMKNFLWEVGPITSTILSNRAFLEHSDGVFYSFFTQNEQDRLLEPLIDVTIIGWGQNQVLNGSIGEKWWYVVPHLGKEYGEYSDSLFPDENDRLAFLGYKDAGVRTGIYRIARKYDVMSIESNSYGAVPYNFKPAPLRTPKPLT